jgi:hypothetical protein
LSIPHRVLKRARWRGREGSGILLRWLVTWLAFAGPMVLGIDDTSERRRGKRIRANGIERDPVRRAPSPFVKARGRRWASLRRRASGPGAARPWARPLLPCLAAWERDRLQPRKRPQPVRDGAGPRPTRSYGGHARASGGRALRTGPVPSPGTHGRPPKERQAAAHPAA